MSENAVEAVENDASGSVTAQLNGVHITVPNPSDWKTRAVRAMINGDIDGWAEIVLSEDQLDRWVQADPTIGQAEKFMAAVMEKTGTNPKASKGSTSSSRNTRKR